VLENVSDADHSSLHAVETAYDAQPIRFIMITACDKSIVIVVVIIADVAGAMFFHADVPVAMVFNAHDEEADGNDSTLAVIEFMVLVSIVTREDSEDFVCSGRWIAAHGLIVDEDSAIHAASRKQVADKARHVISLRSKSIVGPHNQPPTILAESIWGKENQRHHERRHGGQKDRITVR
jgi:hypothetical protein